MIFLRLAWKSLWNRKLTSALTVLSIALSTTLLLSVEATRRAAEEGFTQSISQTDLIVGARSGPLNLILYTVFNMGSATNNVSMETYQKYQKHPAVDWVIPYSLGDGHRGFRVVGTDANFFEHYRFRGDHKVEMESGVATSELWDVVIGSAVAEELNYKLGQKVVVAHGVTKGPAILQHDDKPFQVVGIMKPTGTSLDRSLYISLEGLEALHLDWQNGAQPSKDKMISPDMIKKEDLKVSTITAFFLRTKTRIETLRLQREINTDSQEALLAIIPGVALGELWRNLGYAEQTLKLISWMVVFVGLMAMLIALLTGLNERRREMAILRSLGAGPQRILALLVFESAVLSLIGMIFGVILQIALFYFLKNWIAKEFGFYFSGAWIQTPEILKLLLMFSLGSLVGLIPALRARGMALKDGLRIS